MKRLAACVAGGGRPSCLEVLRTVCEDNGAEACAVARRALLRYATTCFPLAAPPEQVTLLARCSVMGLPHDTDTLKRLLDLLRERSGEPELLPAALVVYRLPSLPEESHGVLRDFFTKVKTLPHPPQSCALSALAAFRHFGVNPPQDALPHFVRAMRCSGTREVQDLPLLLPALLMAAPALALQHFDEGVACGELHPDSLSSSDVGHSAWLAAKMRVVGPYLRGIVNEAARRNTHSDCFPYLPLVAWAAARCRLVDELRPLLQGVSKVPWKPKELSQLVWSVAAFGKEGLAFSNLVARCDRVACDLLYRGSLRGAELRCVFKAFVRLRFLSANAFRALPPSLLRSSDLPTATLVVWAFARALHPHTDIFQAAASAVYRTGKEVDGNTVARLLWAFAVTRQSVPSVLLKRLVHQPHFTHQQFATVLWSQAVLQQVAVPFRPPPSLPDDPSLLTRCVWALANLLQSHPPAVDEVLRLLNRSPTAFSTQDLANVAWALDALSVDPSQYHTALRREVANRPAHEFREGALPVLHAALRTPLPGIPRCPRPVGDAHSLSVCEWAASPSAP
eukprot:Sspe_Gene.113151::Locus_97080_Transcript_2_2_Confidence_0.667_Length_1804::g.113151::m.113151